MKNEKLKTIIYYIVCKLGGQLTRTKLVKLLYLIDYFAIKTRLSATGITGVKYDYYYYGPFSREIIGAVDEMRGYEIMEGENISLEGNVYYLYFLGKSSPRVQTKLQSDEIKVIDKVIEKYGLLELPGLLKKVYATEPLKRHSAGDEDILHD